MDLYDLTIRPIAGSAELDLFCQLPYLLNDELAGDLEAGRRRPEWMWVALLGDRLVARAAWWGVQDDGTPSYLDIFDLDDTLEESVRVDAGARLMRTAMGAVIPTGATPPAYGRFLPPDWRDQPALHRAVTDRMAVLERSGARLLVERLRLEWLPRTPIAASSGRLRFRSVHHRDELIALMIPVLHGTLDAHSQRDLTHLSAEQTAIEQYDGELDRYASPHDWWQVATLPDGEPVGFVIPARNAYNAIIAYIGVLPAHRGRGYIDDILAQGTRILATQDPPRIRAATDVGNMPMAAAFARAGYIAFQREINMTWG